MDKTMRIQSTSPIIKNGFMLIPAFAPWLDAYLHELLLFPNGPYNDQVDSTSQALHWWSQGRGSSWFLEISREECEELSVSRTEGSADPNTPPEPPAPPAAPAQGPPTCGDCGKPASVCCVPGVSGDRVLSCPCGWSRIICQPAKVRTAATVRTPGFTD